MKKTNAMRFLEERGIPYEYYAYKLSEKDPVILEEELGKPRDMIYKTLVSVGKSKAHYVFIIPIDKQLDLKLAASSVHEKSIQMVAHKELLGLSGYVHGGCSPFAMKKKFVTVLDISAKLNSTIIVSAGLRGAHVELKGDDLVSALDASYADVSTRKYNESK